MIFCVIEYHIDDEEATTTAIFSLTHSEWMCGIGSVRIQSLAEEQRMQSCRRCNSSSSLKFDSSYGIE